MRILAATDGSETAERAVRWAADLAARYDGELLLLQVLGEAVHPHDGAVAETTESLSRLAVSLAGDRGRALVAVASDPSRAIVETAAQEAVDVLVVGNAGMGGRKQFLLGNVPNRVSHNARCTVVIVNTAPGEPTVDGEVEEPQVEGELLGRAAHVARVLARFRLSERGRGPASAKDRASALRALLEELGPTLAKIGQILSTRPDLLPPEFVEELATLQDRVTPLTEAEVVAVMEQELRVPWEDVFETIDPEPLAAGTIGQVHRAALESGDRVVVKVQRPTARAEILRDLGLLELFAKKAAGREGIREVIDIPALVEHLSSSLRRELDFREEAANVERMREVLKPYDRLGVPRLYADLSTSRLLVLEEVQGVPLREAPAGEASSEAARQLLEAYYRQILGAGFFHADPHPGNLMWWKDAIYFLDFGMVGEVAPEVREVLVLLLLAFWRNDPAFLAEAMLMLAGDEQPRGLDLKALEREFAAFIERFHGVRSLREIRIGPMLEGLVQIAARHGMRLPAALALSGKAFGQMQLAAAELDPTLDPFSIINRFLLRGTAEQIRKNADPHRLFFEGQKLKLRLTRVLEAAERAAGTRPGARLQIEFLGAAEIEDAIRRTGRRLVVAGTAAAAVAAAGAAWLASDLARRG